MTNKYVAFEGGMDTETPPIEVKPAKLTEGLNVYEAVKGGYTNLLGHERFDGTRLSSSVSYHRASIVDMLSASGAVTIALGTPLVLGTCTILPSTIEYSSDSDEVVIAGELTAGVVNNAEDFPLAFDTGASLTAVGAIGEPTFSWETGTYSTYMNDVQDVTRATITPVPGSSQCRGVAQINDTVIAWRDNAGATALVAHKATSGGWVEIDSALMLLVDTTGLTVLPSIGDLLNTGALQVVGQYDLLDANLAPTTDKYIYAVKHISGSVPVATDTLTRDSDALSMGTIDSLYDWADEIAVGGRIEYVNHNFYAGVNSYNMYFGDGVNTAQQYQPEYDVISPIASNYKQANVNDNPVGYVHAHLSRLFQATTGGTFITSVAGTPDIIDGTLGSVEVGLGDDVTGFAQTSSDKLAVFTRNKTYVLTGNTAATWQLVLASQNSGSRAHMTAQTDDIFSSDDRGIAQLSRTAQTLGGFQAGTVSDDVQTLFNSMSSSGTCATTLRPLNQMRFFYGNRALVVSRVPFTTSGGNAGIRYGLTEALYSLPVQTISTEEDSTGMENTYYSSTNGYIYKMDSGLNADGAAMEFIITTHYNHMNSPLQNKRFEGVDFETTSAGNTIWQVYYYMNDGLKTFDPRAVGFNGTGSQWDTGLFDVAQFDAIPISRPRMTLKGSGYNLQFSFYRQSTQEPQSTVTGYAIRYKNRSLVAF